MRLAKKVWLMIVAIFALILIPIIPIVYFGLTVGEIPEEDLLFGSLFFLFIVSVAIVPAVFGLQWLRDRSIRKNGTLASARILRAESTGLRINNSPVIELDLEVHPPYDQVFETTVDYCPGDTVNPVTEPGARIQVYYIPGTTDVVIAGE